MMRIIRTILIILGMITAYALKRSDSVVDRDHADNDQNNSGRPPPERVAPVGAENSSLSEKSGNKQQSGAETSLGPAENAIVQYTKELAAWTRRLAILTGLLVVVTGILGAIALRTDNTLKETMIHSQRAWVGPYDASIEPISLQKTTSATVSIHNTGKEPALNVHFDGGASVFGRETSAEADANMIKESGEQLKACRVDKSAGYGQVLYPSAGQENTQIQIAVPADLTTQPVIDGKNAIIIRGCVMYDTFAATRHSTFNGKTNASHLSFCSGTSEAT